VHNLALVVFPDFKDHRAQPAARPADGRILFRNVGPPIQPVRPLKQLPRLFETYATTGILPEALALSRIEAKAHRYDCYTTSRGGPRLRCHAASVLDEIEIAVAASHQDGHAAGLRVAISLFILNRALPGA
jgi:hypothetical protein